MRVGYIKRQSIVSITPVARVVWSCLTQPAATRSFSNPNEIDEDGYSFTSRKLCSIINDDVRGETEN